jgi:5,10-methenyltetrahydrofolate synthetase
MGSPGSTLPPGADGILFVVPGVAFDERGARLGRGGGWYDSALARHPAGVRIGLAYDFQIMPLLPRTDRDIPMHVVVTESRLIGGPAGGQWAAKENQS